MAVVPDASLSERTSPFYLHNQAISKEWEQFVLQRGGEIKGKYSAWAYKLIAKIHGVFVWSIIVQKSTYTHRSLIIPPHKNIYEGIELSTYLPRHVATEFLIRKSRFTDRFMWRKKTHKMHPSYVFIAEEPHPFITELMAKILQDPMDRGSFFKATCKNGQLWIKLIKYKGAMDWVQEILRLDEDAWGVSQTIYRTGYKT
jgi:hypothetical protein